MATLIKFLPSPADRFMIGSEAHGYSGRWYTWEQATDHLRNSLHYRTDTINTALELAVDLATNPAGFGGKPEVKLVYPPINPYESGE